MRHSFSFPADVRDAVRAHVRGAIEPLSARSFEQEPSYIAALMGRLIGTAYDGPEGSVRFRTTIVNPIGNAESLSGADLAITADISGNDLRVSKAILAQAKRGSFEQLPRSERDRLIDQINRMRQITRSPKVILLPYVNGRYEPLVASGVRIAADARTEPVSLADYFVRRVLTTLDGDTRPEFVARVQRSDLSQLHVIAALRRR